MFVYLLAIAILLCIIHFTFKYSKNVRLIRKIPGENETFLFGNALDILVSPVDIFNLGRIYAKKYNKGIYRWWCFHITAVNIYNPEDIEIILSTMKHSSKSFVYNFIKDWLQEGLLLSKGEKWQSRRKILTPAFHFNILREFCTILEENSQRLVETLAKSQGEATDVTPVISEYTLSSICETAMGTKLHEEISNEAKCYKNAIYVLGKLWIERFVKFYYTFDFIFHLSKPGRKSKTYLDIVQSFTKKVIKDRKDYIDKHGIKLTENMTEHCSDIYLSGKRKKIAMLDLLLSAEQDGVIDRKGIQEEVDTFMFEGHDTTASGLTHFFMLLANHKNIQDKILRELKDIFGDSNRTATMDDFSKMRYMECCIKESLRLYPPVHFISREISETIQLSVPYAHYFMFHCMNFLFNTLFHTFRQRYNQSEYRIHYLGGYTVPKGSLCHIHIYDLHRRDDLFENAEVFDPDRFLPENSVGRHPYSYIPFSAGPRNCIGQKFAMLELKSCTAAVLRNFVLHPVTRPSDLVFAADLVLRSINPVYVKFVARNKLQ